MKIIRIALNLKGQSPSYKLIFANRVLDSMTGNPAFSTSFPALSSLQSAIDDLKNAVNNARPGDKLSTQVLYDCEARLEKVLRALAAYVEYTGADEPAVLSSGFDTRRKAAQAARLFTVKHGAIGGTAGLAAKSQGANTAYIWQYTKDPIDSTEWTTAGISTLAHFSLAGLAPLTTYWFRVAVINGQGQQNWSDPLPLTVLP